MSDWIEIDHIEDLPVGVELVVWDGCQKHIDYVDICCDTGCHFMANETEPTHYLNIDDPED